MVPRDVRGTNCRDVRWRCHEATMNKWIVRIALPAFVAVGCSDNSSTNPSTNANSSADAKAYIGLFGDKAVAVLDTKKLKVLTTIPVTAPDGIAITPDGKKGYVSGAATGNGLVIATT